MIPAERLADIHRRLAAATPEPVARARHLAASGQADLAAAVAVSALDSTTDPRDRAVLLIIAAGAAPPGAALGLRLEAARALDEVADWPGVQRALDSAGEATEEQLVERDALLAHAAFATGDVAGAAGNSSPPRMLVSSTPSHRRPSGERSSERRTW
jgi:hypothetical protein